MSYDVLYTDVRQQLLEEIAITKVAGSHPHLVGLVGCCTLPENPVCLVLEYMRGGDLHSYLHRMRDALNAANDASPLESPGASSVAESEYFLFFFAIFFIVMNLQNLIFRIKFLMFTEKHQQFFTNI